MNILRNMTIELTNKCLQECIHCSSMSCANSASRLRTQFVISILEQACRLGLRNVSVSGGEPFLYNDLHLDYILKSMISIYELNVSLYSCGIIGELGNLSSIPAERFEQIKLTGLEKIIFSLHGTGDICDQMTKTKNSFKLISNSILNSIKAGFVPEIHFVPTTVNINDFKNLVEYVYKVGIRKISVLRLVPQGRANSSMIPSKQDSIRLLNLSDELCKSHPELEIRKGHPWVIYSDKCKCDAASCSAAENKLVIMANGAVVPCEAFKHISDKSPKVSETNLQDIWDNSELFNEIRLLNFYRNME